uniref:Vesicular inhibitory amino acid transporter n=1 Tax=Cryptocotyle lingua TaxID=66766 RepID=A0A7U0YEY0_9TREM|nr:vesicular inhibitory amino acid transporter [Cryptocotyle lingua]
MQPPGAYAGSLPANNPIPIDFGERINSDLPCSESVPFGVSSTGIPFSSGMLPSSRYQSYGSIKNKDTLCNDNGQAVPSSSPIVTDQTLSPDASESVVEPDFAPGWSTSEMLLSSLVVSLRETNLTPSIRIGRTSYTKGPSAYTGGEVLLEEDHPVGVSKQQLKAYNNAERVAPTWVTGWNVLNMIQGIGILGIPYACVHAGWVSIPVIILVSLICCYTGRLLGECLYIYPETDCPSYFTSSEQLSRRVRVRSTNACIAADVLRYGGRRFVSIAVIAELFGVIVLYLILLGQSTSALLGSVVNSPWPISYWTTIMTYLSVPLLLCRRMRVVTWFGVLCLVGLSLSIAIVIIYCGLELSSTHGMWSTLWAPRLSQLPVSICIIVFSFCAHSALPGIEGSMAKPEQYNTMLYVSFAVAAVAKILIGWIPAFVFGDDVAQAVTDSMSARPVLVIFVHVAVLINVFFSIPLVFFILGEQLDCSVSSNFPTNFFLNRRPFSLQTVWFVSTRMFFLHLALVCATVVPHFALVMGLIGALTGSLLCFIFPAWFHLHLFHTHLTRLDKLIRILIILFGIFVGITGVIFSAWDIAVIFTSKT